MPKEPKEQKQFPPTDFAVRAGFERLRVPASNPTERLTAPIPPKVRQRMAKEVFEGPLSDEEDSSQKHSKPKRHRRRPKKTYTTEKDDERYVDQMGQQLPVNTVHIPVDFTRLAQGKEPLKSAPYFSPMVWNDDVPRKAVSDDGTTLVISIPNLVKERGVKHLNNIIYKYAETVKPRCGKSATGEDRAGEYLERPGQLTGEIGLVRYWHALGQENVGPLMPSADTIRTGTAFSATCKLYKELTSLSRRVNAAVKIADPTFHKQLNELREQVQAHEAAADALNKIDPLLFEGRELIFNRLSDFHRDSQDPQLGYVALYAAGDFKGGLLELPQLNLKVRLEPGDLVLFRGRVLLHKIGEWDKGQRISVPHFTHTSLWRQEKLAGPVTVT